MTQFWPRGARRHAVTRWLVHGAHARNRPVRRRATGPPRRRGAARARFLHILARMTSDLVGLLEAVTDADDQRQALERACGVVRDRLHASGAWVHAAAAQTIVARAGAPPLDGVDAVVARALATGRAAHAPGEALMLRDAPPDHHAGAAASVPLRCGGVTVGTLSCAWAGPPPVDARHAESLLAAAATAAAPHAARWAEARALDAARDDDALGLGLLGASAAIVALRARVRRVAAAPFHVLVDGESGSGKELVARALHAAGPRRARRLCTVNCAALTDELLEAELFGHARGAFTGAVRDRAGLFEEADGGTLFLDEVGELSLRAQAKLLRVIQDGEVRRVGESHARRVDVRLVAATNRVLADEVSAGRFRADLRYRLEVVRIAVVPLRERPDDVAVLSRAFWADAAARTGSRASLHPATLAALARYHWPGNVRELQNVIRALSVNAPTRGVVTPASLPAGFGVQVSPAQTLSLARRGFEERFVRAALARAGHRAGLAARDLGVSRQGLRKLLLRLGIDAGTPADQVEESRC
jgi:transcriptional regulator with GAF, ATPase, and Fis domain